MKRNIEALPLCKSPDTYLVTELLMAGELSTSGIALPIAMNMAPQYMDSTKYKTEIIHEKLVRNRINPSGFRQTLPEPLLALYVAIRKGWIVNNPTLFAFGNEKQKKRNFRGQRALNLAKPHSRQVFYCCLFDCQTLLVIDEEGVEPINILLAGCYY